MYGTVQDILGNIQFLPDKDVVLLVNGFLGSICAMPTIHQADNPGACKEVNANYVAVNERGCVVEDALMRATDEMLQSCYNDTLSEKCLYNEDYNEENHKITQFVLDNITRGVDGRLTVPLTWRGNNINLSLKILSFNFTRLIKDDAKLKMIDNVIKEQLLLGIVEKVENYKFL